MLSSITIAALLGAAVLSNTPRIAGQAAPPTPPDCGEMIPTESGLSYCVVRPGYGRNVTANDVVVMHYILWLGEDGGNFFHSTRMAGDPYRERAAKVIDGFTVGLPLMNKGAIYKFSVPQELGYGEKGGPGIPPKSHLIFKVELLDIIPLPIFQAADPERQKTLPSGVRIEELQAGTGPGVAEGQNCRLNFAEWTQDALLTECTAATGKTRDFFRDRELFPYLAEIVPMLRTGGRYRLEVPLHLYKSGNPLATSSKMHIVELEIAELLEPLRVPEYAPVAESAEKLANGLRYEVVQANLSGEKPVAKSRVAIHYAGWLPDGKLLHSSYAGGAPEIFVVGDFIAIKGWSEAVSLMNVGSTYKVEVPARLAYGRLGSRKMGVPPNTTLTYQIELVEILERL